MGKNAELILKVRVDDTKAKTDLQSWVASQNRANQQTIAGTRSVAAAQRDTARLTGVQEREFEKTRREQAKTLIQLEKAHKERARAIDIETRSIITQGREAERVARQQLAAKNRPSPISQAILTSRFSAPGGQVQPLVGRTAQAFGLSGDQAAGVALAAGAAGVAGAAILSQMQRAIGLAADFEQAMNVLKVQAGATDDEIQQLSDTARDLGDDLTLPATSSLDAARAMGELSKAGLSVQDTMNAAKGTLQLAAAAQIDAGEAANIVASQLAAFSLEGKEAGRVADLLAATANNTLADMTGLAQGAQQASSAFASARQPIENLYTAMGLLSNAGIQASDAGTSLRVMMTRLTAPTDDAAKVMKALGISVYDNQGRVKDLRDIIGQFETKLSTATDQQKKWVSQTVFGEDAQRAFNIVLTAGVDGFDKLKTKVVEQGAAAENAEAQTKGLNGAIEGLKSQWDSFLEKTASPALNFLANVVKFANAGISSIEGMTKALAEFTVGIQNADQSIANSQKTGAESFRNMATQNRAKAEEIKKNAQARNQMPGASGEYLSAIGGTMRPDEQAQVDKLLSDAKQYDAIAKRQQDRIDNQARRNAAPPKVSGGGTGNAVIGGLMADKPKKGRKAGGSRSGMPSMPSYDGMTIEDLTMQAAADMLSDAVDAISSATSDKIEGQGGRARKANFERYTARKAKAEGEFFSTWMDNPVAATNKFAVESGKAKDEWLDSERQIKKAIADAWKRQQDANEKIATEEEKQAELTRKRTDERREQFQKLLQTEQSALEKRLATAQQEGSRDPDAMEQAARALYDNKNRQSQEQVIAALTLADKAETPSARKGIISVADAQRRQDQADLKKELEDTLRQAGFIRSDLNAVDLQDSPERDAPDNGPLKMDNARSAAQDLFTVVGEDAQDILGNAFEKLIKGDIKGMFKSVAKDFGQDLARAASSTLAGEAVKGASGKKAMGTGGILSTLGLGVLGSVFGGLFADGGTPTRGKMFGAGEEGYELAFSGARVEALGRGMHYAKGDSYILPHDASKRVMAAAMGGGSGGGRSVVQKNYHYGDVNNQPGMDAIERDRIDGLKRIVKFGDV